MKPVTFYLKKKKKNDRILTYLIINLPLFVSSQDDDQNDFPLSCCSLLFMSQNYWTKAYIRQIVWKMFAFSIFQKKRKCIERCLSTSRPFLTSCWALITYWHLSYISDSRTKLFIPPFCLMATYFSPVLNISDCCFFSIFFIITQARLLRLKNNDLKLSATGVC